MKHRPLDIISVYYILHSAYEANIANEYTDISTDTLERCLYVIRELAQHEIERQRNEPALCIQCQGCYARYNGLCIDCATETI